jgi:hypothetical protein
MRNEPVSRLNRVAAGSLLVLMAMLAGGSALRESATIDEVAHIGAGVSYLQKLDLRMNFEHPPLAKVLAGLPLVLRGVRADYSHFSWVYSSDDFHSVVGEWSFGHWLLTRWNDARTTVAWARAPMLLLTLGLGLLLYAYASRLGGPRGGLLCLSLFVSTPTFLAFGPLVLTDIAVAFFSLLTCWTLAEMWHAPSRSAIVGFSLSLAGALLAKFSSGLLLIACLILAASLCWFPLVSAPDGPPSSASRRQGWRNLWRGIVWAALLVYAVYFLLSWNQPTGNLAFIGRNPVALAVRRLLMPLAGYGSGLFAFAFTARRPTFLLGHFFPHGVWFFFPVLFLLKSTLAFLALLPLAVVVAAVKRRRAIQIPAVPKELLLHWRAVRVFFAVTVAGCLLSPMNLSIRHFTIPLVFLILLLAPLPRMLELVGGLGWRPARVSLWLTTALAGISLATAVRAYPYYIPFLNALNLGRPGYLLVSDSNLDWNQALPEARQFAEQHGLKTVLVDAYSFSDPSVYVPRAQFWNCQQPAVSDAGKWAVVSANMIAESHNCLWLLRYPHQKLAGGSMYAFELPHVIPAAGAPGGPPLPNAYRNLGGVPGSWPDLRLIFLRGILDPQQLPAALDELYRLGPPRAP